MGNVKMCASMYKSVHYKGSTDKQVSKKGDFFNPYNYTLSQLCWYVKQTCLSRGIYKYIYMFGIPKTPPLGVNMKTNGSGKMEMK